jgi:hypothetical protein
MNYCTNVAREINVHGYLTSNASKINFSFIYVISGIKITIYKKNCEEKFF